jgi:hypothetical protein
MTTRGTTMIVTLPHQNNHMSPYHYGPRRRKGVRRFLHNTGKASDRHVYVLMTLIGFALILLIIA